MGRRKKASDPEANLADALGRIAQIASKADFRHAFDLFASALELKKCPPLEDIFIFNTERTVAFDENARCSIYHGLYYDLREICDLFNLKWPQDGICLYWLAANNYASKLQRAGLAAESILTSFLPCPDEKQWVAWRMARTGAGWPREDELRRVHEFANSQRESKRGLSYSAIANLDGGDVDTRTVQNWIKRCWDYLLEGGSQALATSRAGLNFFEWMFLGELIERERKKRKNKLL